MSKSKLKQDRNERREELLRPSCYLGYDRDELGMYLLSREAYKIAETQFRRAIWLNPFEYRFVLHLAWCFYKQGRLDEAKDCTKENNIDDKDMDEETRTIIASIRKSDLTNRTH